MNDNDIKRDLSSYFDSVALQRPADGELNRAIEATGRIKPRPAWQTRLTPLANTLRRPASLGLSYAMWLVLMLLMLALLATGFGLASRPAAGTLFEGRWRALDPDGSDMTLIVGEGKSPDVRFEDDYASACANRGDDNTHWISIGVGTVDGKEMSVHYPDGGGCSTWHIDPYFALFEYDSDTNTLTDDTGTVWRRPAPK